MAKSITLPGGETLPVNDDNTLTDDNGTNWTEFGYTTADGASDSFGPGHPKTPDIIKELRKLTKMS